MIYPDQNIKELLIGVVSAVGCCCVVRSAAAIGIVIATAAVSLADIINIVHISICYLSNTEDGNYSVVLL